MRNFASSRVNGNYPRARLDQISAGRVHDLLFSQDVAQSVRFVFGGVDKGSSMHRALRHRSRACTSRHMTEKVLRRSGKSSTTRSIKGADAEVGSDEDMTGRGYHRPSRAERERYGKYANREGLFSIMREILRRLTGQKTEA